MLHFFFFISFGVCLLQIVHYFRNRLNPSLNRLNLHLVDLPVPLVVVIHENEGRGKSTGVHAGVLCPKAQIVIFPAERRAVVPGESNCVDPDDGFNAWRRLDLGEGHNGEGIEAHKKDGEGKSNVEVAAPNSGIGILAN